MELVIFNPPPSRTQLLFRFFLQSLKEILGECFCIYFVIYSLHCSLTTQKFVASHTKTFSHVSELMPDWKKTTFPSFECENDPRKTKFYLEIRPAKKGAGRLIDKTNFWVALRTYDHSVFASSTRIQLRKSVSQRQIAEGKSVFRVDF